MCGANIKEFFGVYSNNNIMYKNKNKVLPTCDSYEGTEDEQTIRSLDENMTQRGVTLLVAYETGEYL